MENLNVEFQPKFKQNELVIFSMEFKEGKRLMLGKIIGGSRKEGESFCYLVEYCKKYLEQREKRFICVEVIENNIFKYFDN